MNTKVRITATVATIAALVTPALALAASGATGINITAIETYSDGIIGLINRVLVPVLMAVAFIVFLYGVYKYFIYNGDSDSERETGRTYALYGVIGFVIILSLWGLVNLTMSVLGLSAGSAPPYPTIGGSGTPTGGVGSTCTGSGRGTCNTGLTCTSGICQASTGGGTTLKGVGATCATSSECQSGYCHPERNVCEAAP